MSKKGERRGGFPKFKSIEKRKTIPKPLITELRKNILPFNHPLYNFPPVIQERYIIGEDAIQNAAQRIGEKVCDEMNASIKARAKAVAVDSLAESLHYALHQHLSVLLNFLRYARNNMGDIEEREKILYCIDQLLNDPYWKMYLDANRPE